jgi:hypothetical protein
MRRSSNTTNTRRLLKADVPAQLALDEASLTDIRDAHRERPVAAAQPQFHLKTFGRCAHDKRATPLSGINSAASRPLR